MTPTIYDLLRDDPTATISEYATTFQRSRKLTPVSMTMLKRDWLFLQVDEIASIYWNDGRYVLPADEFASCRPPAPLVWVETKTGSLEEKENGFALSLAASCELFYERKHKRFVLRLGLFDHFTGHRYPNILGSRTVPLQPDNRLLDPVQHPNDWLTSVYDPGDLSTLVPITYIALLAFDALNAGWAALSESLRAGWYTVTLCETQ